MSEENDARIEKAIDLGGNVVGASAGAAIGAVAGPLGVVAGAVVGTIAEQTIIFVGNEIKERILSKRESKRIGTVYQIAAEKINANLEAGKELRTDGFFESKGDERPDSEELLEGILLIAQREYEEKKLKCLGNLYANLAFDNEVTPQNANTLIKLAESLTYRQLCEICTVAMFQILPEEGQAFLKKTAYQQVHGVNKVSIASEIFDLYQRTILASKSAILSAGGINPSELKVVGNGVLLFRLMELSTTIPILDRTEIIEFLADQKVTVAKETTNKN